MSWLACCLYLSGGFAYMLPHAPAAEYHSLYWRYDINQIVNPYGLAEIGYTRDFGKFAVEVGARHDSSIPVSDFGQNTLEVRVRWYPFRSGT